MRRLTERDEYGNADIIGVNSPDLQMNLEFDEFNRVTDALNKLAAYEDMEIPIVPIDVCKIAVDTFGEDAQTDMVIEEMSELTKALLKLRRKRKHGIEYGEPGLEDVAEETADVIIMLVQLLHMFGSDFVESVEVSVAEKIKRLKMRLLETQHAKKSAQPHIKLEANTI